jgi:glucose-1-phosphate cytidylyltransferase
VSLEPGSSLVSGVHAINNGSVRINGGYFIFKKEIFDYIGEREELVIEPFQRLMQEKELVGYSYDGFWAGMDTFKDKQELERLWSSGVAPWHVWRTNGHKEEGIKPRPPMPVAEVIERRSSGVNGFLRSAQSARN